MKLKKRYKKSSGSRTLSKSALLFLITLLMPLYSFAEPVVGGMPLPPASFTHVEDIELLNKLGMGYSHGGAWCYDSDANAILITAASREKAQCELRLQYELERQRVKLQFEIDKLNIRIDTLVKQHEEINLIKDQEINKLTDAALKRPNDYSVWWASGGVAVGVITTVLITMAVSN